MNDESANRPEWIGIGTGFFGTKRVLVPIEGATVEGDEIRIRYSADQVKHSPDIDSDEISYEREQELYAYYRLGGGGESDDDSDQSLTRSEEELRLGKEKVQTGKARLRKWVETEPVEANVELRHETAEITRERIDQPVGDVELGEEEIEVPLHEERAVVEKRTVAKERIGVDKDVKTETETVRDEVRKERVEVEEDR